MDLAQAAAPKLRTRTAPGGPGPGHQVPPAPLALNAVSYRLSAQPGIAVRCLAFGIGPHPARMIDDQVRAPWFAHLHHTAVGSGTLSGPARCLPGARRFLAFVPPSHVASVALPMAPTPAELALACELGTLLLQHRVFVVMTTSSRAAGVLAQLGQACDCIVTGDGGAMHHQYPLRTMMEPASGRLICYGLYDACILWAGRLGEYAAPDMTTAALLHVEIPATVPTLIEIDALITPIRDGLDDPGALRLASIVEGGLVDLAKISFRTDRLIRQDRAELPPESQPTPMSGQTWS